MKTKHTLSMKTKTKDTQNHKKAITRHHSSPLPSCFQPHAPPHTTTTTTTNPNLTTCLYQTHLGLFSLSWSRSFLSRALHLTLHPLSPVSPVSPPSPVFHLSLKPFLFWNKQGIKQLTFPPHSLSPDPTSIWVFWDFTSAKFGPGPEPETGYYIAVLHQGEMTLLVGDQEKEAYAKTKAKKPKKIKSLPSPTSPLPSLTSPLVLRREHVLGKNKFYTTRMELGGRIRLISIELSENCEDGPRLLIKFDQKRVIMVKHLRWKFRGSERIEFDGHPIQLSWDVYNWLFDGEESGGGKSDDGYALFTFRLIGSEDEGTTKAAMMMNEEMRERGVVQQWSQDSCGLNYERKKMKKRLMVRNRSPSLSSSSLSSVSSGCSSVLEWESVEENELKGPTGFSLLVYAWKS